MTCSGRQSKIATPLTTRILDMGRKAKDYVGEEKGGWVCIARTKIHEVPYIVAERLVDGNKVKLKNDSGEVRFLLDQSETINVAKNITYNIKGKISKAQLYTLIVLL